ncbi:MAG: hypothetical protein AAGF11_41855 [Myxococcota bacterium]
MRERSVVVSLWIGIGLGLACNPNDGGAEDGGEVTEPTTTGEVGSTDGDESTGSETEASATGDTGDTEGTEGPSTGAEDTEGPPSAIPGRDCPPDSFVTANNFGMPLMLSHCNGCHSSALPEAMRQGAPMMVDFDTVQDVRDHAESIYTWAADDHEAMPPVGGPSAQERVWLGDWLACGAP